MTDRATAGFDTILGTALLYPETYEEAPWGHRAVKVRDKIFVFFGADGGELSVSLKLPISAAAALALPQTRPTGYGLGKAGWVSARFPADIAMPTPMLLDWLDESYRAMAPKSIVRNLPDYGAPDARPPDKQLPQVPKLDGPILVAGDDPFRVDRATRVLEAAGAQTLRASLDADVLLTARESSPAAIVLDLGRRTPDAWSMLNAIDAGAVGDVPFFVAGLGDAKTEKRARDAASNACGYTRRPPGDLKALGALIARLCDHGGD